MEGLFAIVSRERLTEILTTLQSFINLPLQLIGPDGTALMELGGRAHYCRLLTKELFTEKDCARLHGRSARYAQQLGEAYVYTCRANLNHIAYPLLDRGNLLGSIIVGPFLMDTPDSTILSDLVKNRQLTPAMALDLYDSLSEMKVIPPERVDPLRRLIGYLLEPLLPSERALMMQARERSDQQSRISETIQMFKEQQLPEKSQLYEKETALLSRIRTGDREAAREELNGYIAYVLYSDGGSEEVVRARAVELCTLLSRIAIEGGGRPETIYTLNSRYLKILMEEEKPENLIFCLQDFAESYMDAMFMPSGSGNPCLREAMRFIAHHYAEPLDLKKIAAAVDLSPNYFSRLFKNGVGLSVHDYLNQVRVEESKKLLLTTRYSLAEIALAMGFSDESYYCKVFRKVVGMTPGKFRS